MQRITSRDNPLVKRARALASSSRECRKHRETLLDGPHLVSSALAASVPIKAVLVSDSGLRSSEVERLVEGFAGASVAHLPDALFERISPVDSPSGILALIDLPDSASGPLSGDVLVLEAVQDGGNLGSILRTAAAAGIERALLTPGCAQAWSPKVLRAGMGAHFALRISEQVDVLEALVGYQGRIAATLPAAESSLYGSELRGNVAWLFGSEGAGLSTSLANRADLRLRIPMHSASESLNVGAAVAVCLFEQWRQRHSS